MSKESAVFFSSGKEALTMHDEKIQVLSSSDYIKKERMILMKISPYLSFNGNCAEAVALYEKVFNTKAEIMRYSDAPENVYQSPPGTESHIMHAALTINGEAIMMSDMPPEYPVTFGSNITLTVEFGDEDASRAAFDILKDGGEVAMEMQETFWSKCFGTLKDKFGVHWNISV